MGLPAKAAPDALAPAVALPRLPAATVVDSTWMASFLDVLRVILILLGGDANALNGQVTTEQAMSVVQQRYAASGVPSTLSTGERILLHNTATLALAMLNSAPADVDSAAVASFRITLTDIAGRTVVPLPFGSESFSPATAP